MCKGELWEVTWEKELWVTQPIVMVDVKPHGKGGGATGGPTHGRERVATTIL